MLRISQSGLDALRKHGEETYPQECCGALLGRFEGAARQVTSVARCENTRTDSPRNRYHIDPGELIRIQRRARERGEEVVGFYHSHPDHPARWSQTDLEEAHWVGCSYVITAVEGGRAGRTRSFFLAGQGEDDKHFEDEEIEVVGAAAGVESA